MSAFFDNKIISPKTTDKIFISVELGPQPSVTGIYIDGKLVVQVPNNDEVTITNYPIGDGKTLKNKKIRLHTTVQDKNDNTDDICVMHKVSFGTQEVKREVNTTAAEEDDLFDIFTDIRVF